MGANILNLSIPLGVDMDLEVTAFALSNSFIKYKYGHHIQYPKGTHHL